MARIFERHEIGALALDTERHHPARDALLPVHAPPATQGEAHPFQTLAHCLGVPPGELAGPTGQSFLQPGLQFRVGDAVFSDRFAHKDLAAWLNEGKEPVRILCADCGGRIKDSVQKSTGELIPAAQCAAMAQKYVGRPLCKACLLKAMKQKKEGSAHDPSQPAQEPAQ